MSRDALGRMDVDTKWLHHRKVRQLRARYPDAWPTLWCAYMALLGEAWSSGTRRLTLEDALAGVAMPLSVAVIRDALQTVEIVDADGRVPRASWREWFGPAEERLRSKSASGQQAAHNRWHPGVPFATCQVCAAMRTHSQRNAPRLSTPATPATPRARSRGSKETEDQEDRAGRVARAQAVLADPKASKERKRAAQFQLDQLGAA